MLFDRSRAPLKAFMAAFVAIPGVCCLYTLRSGRARNVTVVLRAPRRGPKLTRRIDDGNDGSGDGDGGDDDGRPDRLTQSWRRSTGRFGVIDGSSDEPETGTRIGKPNFGRETGIQVGTIGTWLGSREPECELRTPSIGSPESRLGLTPAGCGRDRTRRRPPSRRAGRRRSGAVPGCPRSRPRPVRRPIPSRV